MTSSGYRQGAAESELWSEFEKAIQEGNEARVRQILESKATSSGTEKKSSFLTRKIVRRQGTLTALHLAVMKGEEKIAKLLIEKGSDVNVLDEHKRSPLHVAVEQENSIPIIQLLLNQKDININATDEYKNTPLKLAAEKGNVEAVIALLKKGADITKEDRVQNTAIHVAAKKGNFDVLKKFLPYLKENPGLTCKPNKLGDTPLHLAVRRKCQKTVVLLLSSGAFGSLEVTNKNREKPKDVASGEREIVELLKPDNSEKREKILREIFSTPCAEMMGGGGHVEADSPGNEAASRYHLLDKTVIKTFAGASGIVPQFVFADKLNINCEYKTDVYAGGVAAVGPGGQVNLGDFPIAATGHSQLVPDQSTYNINVSGGNACIGDKSVVNVATGSPRSPSTADSREGPWFPDHEDNGDDRGQGNSVTPLSYPVLENKSSGYPTENVSTPQELSHPIPEEGKKASDSGNNGELSHPIPEEGKKASDSGNNGELSHPIPEEGKKASDCDINGELSYSIPEEGKEARGSNIDGKLPHPIPEEGKKERLSPNSGGLCCQGPEGASSGTEIINELDTNGKDPAPVPEERRPGTAELVASSSSKDGKVTGKTLEKFTSEQSVTGFTQPSIDKKSKEWLDLRDTSTTSTAAAASNRCAAKCSVRSEDISESQDRMTGPFRAENQESETVAHCQTPAATNSAASVTNQYVERPTGRPVDSVGAGNPVTTTPPVLSEQRRAEPLFSSQKIQPLQSSGEEKVPRVGFGSSSSKRDGSCSQALAKDKASVTSNAATPFTGSMTKEDNNHLLKMGSSSTSDKAVDLSCEFLSEQPAVIQEKRPKSHNVGSQDEDTSAKGDGTSENGGRLNRVGLKGSPGTNTMVFEARVNDDSSASSVPCARGGGEKKLDASSGCSSFSKESSHRKEKFLRGASLPDKGTREENSLQMVGPIRSTGTSSPVQDPSAGILSEKEREQRLVFTGNQRDENHSLGDINLDENSTLIRITDPEDDNGGKKSCNCRIF
ncbi:uncharacterized protein [Montipora foliosa]|uniref:uncharacterized protein isoform X2 n=1 Tax=Montipora foliosa TaxID=591990 RepID=UPI0035F15BE5